MNIEFKEENDILTVMLSGELDHHSSVNLKNRLEMKLSTNMKNNIIIDLNGLTFMDSSGISFIYNAYKTASNFGHCITVLTDNERFIKILRLSAMDSFVRIVRGKECVK